MADIFDKDSESLRQLNSIDSIVDGYLKGQKKN